MCWCTPMLRTPNCGRPNCHPPGQPPWPAGSPGWRPPVMSPPRGAPAPVPSLGLARPDHAGPPASGPFCPTCAANHYCPTHNPAPAPAPADGATRLSKAIGIPRDELQAIWGEVQANSARLRACPSHSFDRPLDAPGSRLRVRWACSACGGTVDGVAKGWYELGRQHGPVAG